ncbi:teleost multiple tissue opsin 2a isoform 1-T1 [Pholidichthys leucotaenia]
MSSEYQTTDPISDLGPLPPGGLLVVSVVLGSILVLGSLTNLLVLVLFCRFRSLRTRVNILLVNISVSDLLVCLCGTSLSFRSSLSGSWVYGPGACSWYGFINSCLGIVSLVSLSILSYDRYSSLMVPNQQSAGYRKPLLAVGMSWLYSVAWTIPPLIGWSRYGPEGVGFSCSVVWTERTAWSRSYVVCLFVFCLGVPVLVMAYSYGRLLHTVRQAGHIRRSAARRREFHILLLVVTAVTCFLICWLPYGVVAMMATFGHPGLISPVASIIPSLLAKSSAVINPVIYILMNRQFYHCFLILFRCKHPLMENGHLAPPSRTTAVHPNHLTAAKSCIQEEEGNGTAESGEKMITLKSPIPESQ